MVSVLTVTGATAMTRQRAAKKWQALRNEGMATFCRNCTYLSAPFRGKDIKGNEVPLCYRCYTRLRIKAEYPSANRAARRSTQKTIIKEKRVI